MRFEVVAGEDGSVRLSDLRAALGRRALAQASVLVTLVAGDLVVRAEVRLVDRPSGPGRHRCFACPACGGLANVLRSADGRLVCAR